LVMREGTLTTLAWGFFIILIGALWIVADVTKLNVSSYFALGVGLILICLNLARRNIGTGMSRFSLGLGIVALLVGFSGVGGLMLPLIPTIVVVIGLFIVAEAVAKKGPS
jgi:uncharacterized membrane protein